MFTKFLVSSIILIVMVGLYTIISIARAKVMGPDAPHSCTDGCESCQTHCDKYHVDELKEEIKASINLNK